MRHGIDAENYSELEFLTLEEIRFYGCMSMSLRPGYGMIYAYPLPTATAVVTGRESPGQLREVAFRLIRHIKPHQFGTSSLVLPPVDGEPPYTLHDAPFDRVLLNKLIQAASLRNRILMRGLGTFLKADMLWQHAEFSEPATTMLFVSMEASLRLVLNALREKGVRDPTPNDAGAFIDETFNPQIDSGGYFVEYYAQRIMALHPSSRFGEFAFPPLQADDYYHLRQAMISVYAYLLVRHLWPND